MSKNEGHLLATGERRDRCPLCGGENHCKPEAAGQCEEGTCWCCSQTFPPALLGQLPEGDKDVRCICQKCLRKFIDKQA